MPDTPEILHEQLLDKALAEAAAIVREIVQDCAMWKRSSEEWRKKSQQFHRERQAAEAERDEAYAVINRLQAQLDRKEKDNAK